MPAREPPLVGFAAYSGTGKTTLLVKLLRILTGHGLRVGVVKHAHHTFDIDQPGKDSYVLRKAGASKVLIGSKKRWALIVEAPEPAGNPLEFHLRHFDTEGLDLVLVEGFKPEKIPKIELYRPALGNPLLFPDDARIIAVATDGALPGATTLPVLDLNNPDQIADFIVDRFLPSTQN